MFGKNYLDPAFINFFRRCLFKPISLGKKVNKFSKEGNTVTKFGSIGLAIAGIISSGAIAPLAASAIEVYKDTSGSVYVTGATPSLATEFVFTGVTQTKSVVSNSCGAISLKGSSTSPLPSTVTIFGNDYNVSAIRHCR